jgi:hypothetical protein
MMKRINILVVALCLGIISCTRTKTEIQTETQTKTEIEEVTEVIEVKSVEEIKDIEEVEDEKTNEKDLRIDVKIEAKKDVKDERIKFLWDFYVEYYTEEKRQEDKWQEYLMNREKGNIPPSPDPKKFEEIEEKYCHRELLDKITELSGDYTLDHNPFTAAQDYTYDHFDSMTIEKDTTRDSWFIVSWDRPFQVKLKVVKIDTRYWIVAIDEYGLR